MHAQGLAGACSVLTHPLEPLVGLHTEEGVSERGPMAGERILWSSREVPYIATHNQVCNLHHACGLKEKARLQLPAGPILEPLIQL